MSDLAPGSVFAGCRVEAVAGRGGMGVVYRATELHLGRPVALKLIGHGRASDPELRRRFEQEARLAASIDHPNVVPVYGAGEDDGVPYLVMRWVGGTDLHALLREEGRLAPERAARIALQVASALDAAHAAGLVHRDVKPANVLLDAGDHAYLTDFGLTVLAEAETRVTQTGRWVGSVDFVSPEQLAGRRCDARSDVYSLGCLLFAALTGSPPFRRTTVPATMAAQLHDPVPRASEAGVPAAFDRVFTRALAKEPADRYPSAGDFGRAALAAARGERVTEEERSVAIGDAAPAAATLVLEPAPAPPPVLDPGQLDAAAMRGDAAAPAADSAREDRPSAATWVADADTAATVADPTAVVARVTERAPGSAHDTPPRPRRVHRPRRRRVARLAAAGIAAAVALGVLLARTGDGSLPPAVEPVGEGEVRAVAERFAAAYGSEDARSLRGLLARDVVRVSPAAVQRGRDAVVGEYTTQFARSAVTGYELEDVEARGGDAGRAAVRYRVRRQDADGFSGRMVLGIVKEHGRVRIKLIALMPDA